MIGSVKDVAAAIQSRQSFVLTSHSRPDGDAVGSQLALAFALETLGKKVRLVGHDPAPAPYRVFPGVDRIEVTAQTAVGDAAVIVLECGTLARPDVGGFERAFVINIDHHPGNTMYGAVNWFDETASACTELVAELIDALGVPWTRDIATHLYLGIVTDTGGFRHGHISARTFDLCRRIVDAGVDVSLMARQIFDSFGIGRVRLTGAILGAMELHAGDRLAVLAFDDALLAQCGATADDTDNLVNLPLAARDILAVALIKRQTADECRVSFRSKGRVDVRAVAAHWHGGGHTNAAGCTIAGPYEAVKSSVIDAVTRAIDAAGGSC
jgi:phosphoesterase RecJ-like protein